MSKYTVNLNAKQREYLEDIIRKGKSPASKINHAHILLKADKGPEGPRWTDRHIQEVFGLGETMLKVVRKRFVEEGLEEALERKRQPRRPEKQNPDGKREAQVIAFLCTEQPEGAEKWTLRAIADRAVELEIVESISYETIRKVLKKNELKPWLKKQWCIAPIADANYIDCMEDVLDVYTRPYDARYPQVCLDEGSVQFVKELREAIAMKRGKVKREDYQYDPDGFANVFIACEPLGGKRFLEIKERRTRKDFALFLRDLVDKQYPHAEKIILVMDNLNTHTTGSLYTVFSPEEAMRIKKKLEIHYTPKHGSWLNMAEIELSVLGRQCLCGRIKDIEEAKNRASKWQEKRNAKQAKINWRFTTQDARIRLARLYPVIEA
ncbi:IS630 family transposase [Dictyobacter arantiisoli]|uniref:IS630 family transposase n=1 Tax=Dictyobacter arantiisoli TaxID=2014874 RepID=A0A5A5TLF0_9CHLR|nr:IS630 family transposase [Dictyobacter arantiisoli]GCF11969.1 IS630 family transposase [Dictyobacter arantiisoli]